MAGQQWPLPEPHERWPLKSDLRKKELLKSGLIKRWVSGPKPDKKPEEPRKQGLLGPGPLEPLPLGMNCKPSFKDWDRLPSCCFSRQKNRLGKCPTSMDSRRWVSAKEGVDHVRAGCPSPQDVITRGLREGFLPMIAHRIPHPPPKKIHRQPPKGAELCSKRLPAQPAQKALEENNEASRSQHPLATYLKLEKELPPDLLKVMEVLDPDRELEDRWAYCEGTQERKKNPTHLYEEYLEEVIQEIPKAVNLEPPHEVNLEPPHEVNLEPPKAVNLEPPHEVNMEYPWKFDLELAEAVNLEPPKAVNLETPEAVDLEPPQEVNLESPWKSNLKPPWKLNLEPAEAVNLEPPAAVKLEPEEKAHVELAKESLQSYLSSLFPEEEQKESYKTVIPKVPVNQKPRRTETEFCRVMDDNFGDISIDEQYIKKKFEMDFRDYLTNNAVKVPVYQKPRQTESEFCRVMDDNFGDISIDEQYIKKKFEMDFRGHITNNAVKIKETSHLPLNRRPCKKPEDIKQRKFSLQEDYWERKLQKPQDPYKPKREKIRYGAWYLEPKSWKKQVDDQPLPDPKVIRDMEYWKHGRHLQPDIIDELYGPISFKDFIVSKGYEMPGVIEKMFLRKGWTYQSVKTPIDRVMKLLSKSKEEDSEEEED